VSDRGWLILIVAVALLWGNGGEIIAPSGITAATYVYEQRDGAVPSAVMAGLNRLNRERKIVATAVDDDITDGTGDTPEQYKPAFTAAKELGIPVLIVTAGG